MAIRDEMYYSALSEVASEDGDDSETPPFSSQSHAAAPNTALGWFSARPLRILSLSIMTVAVAFFAGIIDQRSFSILLVSILFTWFHIWLALKMCFHPLDFVGFRFRKLLFGWQGVVPSKARRMATISCDLMIDRLIHVDEIIDRIHPSEMYRFIRSSGVLERLEDEITAKLRFFN